MRNVVINDGYFGDGQRLSFQEDVLNNEPIIPRPVEYEDIDRSVVELLEKKLVITDNEGKELPLYTLFSNQRFTEYTQTWSHTDEDGNLLLDFKTLTRENAPQWGTLYSGAHSIPGHNRFTLCMREIIDDTGVECYEVTSMSQPLQIDLKYTIGIVTSRIETINEFNKNLNALFYSKQCYIQPNGYYMPTILETVNDNTDYTIDGRKFFIQTGVINVLAYIIPKDDIKVQLVPKRKSLSIMQDKQPKTFVSIDFDDNNESKLKINFRAGVNKVTFDIDNEMSIKLLEKINANGIKMRINDNDVDINGELHLEEGDTIKISIKQPKQKSISKLIFDAKIE